jgi:hypothetical protein
MPESERPSRNNGHDNGKKRLEELMPADVRRRLRTEQLQRTRQEAVGARSRARSRLHKT